MKKFYYYSDVGCIKIGNENFNSMLLNGRGEGSFWIYLCQKEENRIPNGYEFISNISGSEINVYENELGEKVILRLKRGVYSIFNKKGDILIKEQKIN